MVQVEDDEGQHDYSKCSREEWDEVYQMGSRKLAHFLIGKKLVGNAEEKLAE